jgi:hypothetical protein
MPFGSLSATDGKRVASRYEEYWTDTSLFVEGLLDAAGVRHGTRLLNLACGPGYQHPKGSFRVSCHCFFQKLIDVFGGNLNYWGSKGSSIGST